MIPVLKRLASLLLSLLLCLSLLPDQAIAADTMEDVPPVQTEAPETGHPNDPDELRMSASQEYPGEEGAANSED